MTDTTKQNAVIYTRSASHGADHAVQGARCRDHATLNGYAVIETFADHGSGNAADRPGLAAMIGFLTARTSSPPVVIIDDASRLARNVALFDRLRDAIQLTGSRIVSPHLQEGAQ